jgi:RHS repeat-associated protein
MRFSSKPWMGFGGSATSGLYYYGYRFYDPYLQRWPNQDPFGERGFELLRHRQPSVLGDGPNRYLFVGNDPINWVDLFGLSSLPSSFWAALASGDLELAETILAEMVELGEAGPGMQAALQEAKAAAQRMAQIGARCIKNTGKLANKLGKTKKQVEQAIHAAKNKMKVPGNPDVTVDPVTGEIYPITKGGGLGDSIGDILEWLEKLGF